MSQHNLTEGWAEFVAIVESGSISSAARRLDVPRASLSRRLAALEERLNTRLLHRTTQQLSLTQSGEVLFEHAKRVLADAQYTIEAIHEDAQPRGQLRISTPPMIGDLSDLFLDFATRYPEIELIIHQSIRHVDIIGERFDIALRAGVLRNDNLIARRLVRNEIIAVASTNYINKHGHPKEGADLVHHRCIVGFGGSTQPMPHWPLKNGGTMHVKTNLACGDILMQLRAVVKGHGIAMLPQLLVQPMIERGQLQHILPELLGVHAYMNIVYPARDYLPMRTRAFIDHTVEWVAQRKDSPFLRPDWSINDQP